MRFPKLLAGLLCVGFAVAQQTTTTSSDDGLVILTGTVKNSPTTRPTGTYQSYSTTITLASTALSTGLESVTSNGTSTGTDVQVLTQNTVTYLTGSIQTSSALTGNFSTSTTSETAPVQTNTRPCNNYPEFCERKYSNITQVGCHNSPFTQAGSVASNQALPVTTQLDDGVRFLQAQIQWPTNGTVPHFCHTSCDLLDAGPITDWLSTVRDWVANHPYDVVTILLGNGNYSKPEMYVPFIESSGILQYIWTPPKIPMDRDDWPTLASMILTGQRVVMFLDYDTNSTAFPWLLDEFTFAWETPFDPVDRSFPCTVQRPPDLSPEDAKKRLYIMNHNLNVEVTLLGQSLSVPATTLLNTTNNVTGEGSLGLAANNCRSDWGIPPNVLNVDYYNFGDPPGSVFQVAAAMNNVTYNRQCCGAAANPAARVEMLDSLLTWCLVATAAWLYF